MPCSSVRPSMRVGLARGVLQVPLLMPRSSSAPSPRPPHPSLAAVFAFLASKAAAFITGQTLAVDGGYSVMGMY